MLFEEALVAFVAAHAQLGPIFGARIYPFHAPKTEQRAALIYRMDRRPTDQLLVGQTGKEDRLYMLAVWDVSYLTAKHHAEAVLRACNQRRLPIGPWEVVCFIKDQRDVEAEDAQLYGVEMETQFLFMNDQQSEVSV
jgi:hypothetical protein